METLKYAEILQLNKELKSKIKGGPFKVAVLSNVIVSSIKEPLEYVIRRNWLNPEINIGNFDNIVQDSAHYASADLVIVFYELLNIVDCISGYFEAIDDQTLQSLEEKLSNEVDLIMLNLKKTPKVIFNFFSTLAFETGVNRTGKLVSFTERLNQQLQSRTDKNLVFLDLDKIVVEIGRAEAYDYRFYLSSKAPYTLQFFKHYLTGIEPEIRKMTGKAKKALLLDCDNTLWKGVVGEDGIQGINLSATNNSGKPFQDVQHIIKFLSANGVILALVSKNNLKDVEEVFLNHPDMVLKPEDIVVWKVNWTDKATSIREIAKELNIGLDSLVFVDDSDFEINLVKEQLPEVVTLQVPKSTYLYSKVFIKMYRSYFNLANNKEDRKKTQQYKEQFLREEEKQRFKTTEDYIESLGINVSLKKDDISSQARLAQLTQKTNQFNLTMKRYSETEMEDFILSEKHFVFSGAVSDKFGDSGITILAIVSPDTVNDKHLQLDTFLMSCRIIGRNIEHAVLGEILSILKNIGFERVYASYLPTVKNEQVSEFYELNGFELVHEEDGNKQYLLNLNDYVFDWPTYLKLI
jgi:FkbH-like protein